MWRRWCRVEHHLRVPLPCLWQTVCTGGGGCLCDRHGSDRFLLVIRVHQSNSSRPDSSSTPYICRTLSFKRSFSTDSRQSLWGRGQICVRSIIVQPCLKGQISSQSLPASAQIHPHKTKNIHFDGPSNEKPCLSLRATLLEGKLQKYICEAVGAWKHIWEWNYKKKRNRVSEIVLEYVHAALWRETCGADVYGFVEEGNVDGPLAEASLLKADGKITWLPSWSRQLLPPSVPSMTCCSSPPPALVWNCSVHK